MKTLSEMSADYRFAAERAAVNIEILGVELCSVREPERRRAIQHSMRLLREIRRESNELAELTEKYYIKGYCISERYKI